MKNRDFGLIFVIAVISCFLGQYCSQQDINAIEVTTSLLVGLTVTLFVDYIHRQTITKH